MNELIKEAQLELQAEEIVDSLIDKTALKKKTKAFRLRAAGAGVVSTILPAAVVGAITPGSRRLKLALATAILGGGALFGYANPQRLTNILRLKAQSKKDYADFIEGKKR